MLTPEEEALGIKERFDLVPGAATPEPVAPEPVDQPLDQPATPDQEATLPPDPIEAQLGIVERHDLAGKTLFNREFHPSGISTWENVAATGAGLTAGVIGGIVGGIAGTIPGGGPESPAGLITGGIGAGAVGGATDYFTRQSLLHLMDEYGDTPGPEPLHALIAAGIGGVTGGTLSTGAVALRAGAEAFPKSIGAVVRAGQAVSRPITKAVTTPIYAIGRPIARGLGDAGEYLLSKLPSSAREHIDPSQELDLDAYKKILDFARIENTKVEGEHMTDAFSNTPQAIIKAGAEAEIAKIRAMPIAKGFRRTLIKQIQEERDVRLAQESPYVAEPVVADTQQRNAEQVDKGLRAALRNIRDDYKNHPDEVVQAAGRLINAVGMKTRGGKAWMSLESAKIMNTAKQLMPEEVDDLMKEMYVQGRGNTLVKYQYSDDPIDGARYRLAKQFSDYLDDLYAAKKPNLRQYLDTERQTVGEPAYALDYFPGFLKGELRGNDAIERIMMEHPEFGPEQVSRALAKGGRVEGVLGLGGDPMKTLQERRLESLQYADTDLASVLARLTEKEAPRLAMASTFNGQEMQLGTRFHEDQIPLDLPQSVADFGQYLLDKGYTNQYKLFQDWTKAMGQHKITEGDRAARAAAAMISNNLLGYSWLTSSAESQKILTMPGPFNALRGLAATSGEEGENAQRAINAMTGHSPMREFMEGADQPGPFGATQQGIGKNVPMEVGGNVEANNRTYAARAGVGYAINIGKQAAYYIKNKAEFPPRLLKEAADAFDDLLPGEVAARRLGAPIAKGGQIPFEDLLVVGDSLSRRWFYTQHLADVGKAFSSSGGALAGLYKGYAFEAWKMLKKDIMEPILSGVDLIRNKEPGGWGLIQLGLERGVRHGIGSAALGSASSITKAFIRGSALNYKSINDYAYGMLTSALGQYGGFGGDVAGALAGAAIGHERLAQDPFSHPALSLFSQSGQDIGAVISHLSKGDYDKALPRGIRLAGKLAGFGDPNAPLVGNLVGNLVQAFQGEGYKGPTTMPSLDLGESDSAAYPSRAFLDDSGQLPGQGQLPNALREKVEKYNPVPGGAMSGSPEDIMTRTVFMESAGQPFEGQVAVAYNLINRAKEGRAGRSQFATTPEAVATQRNSKGTWQYSAWGNPNLIHRALNAEQHNTEAYQTARAAVHAALTGSIDDPSHGGNHYYAFHQVNPSWAHHMQETAVIGDHRFLRG